MDWSPEIRNSIVRSVVASIVFAYLMTRRQRDEQFSPSVFVSGRDANSSWHIPTPQIQSRKRTFSDEQLSEYLTASLARYPTSIQRLLRTMREPPWTSEKAMSQNITVMLAMADQMSFISSMGPEERYKARYQLVRDFCDAIAECIRFDSGIDAPTQT